MKNPIAAKDVDDEGVIQAVATIQALRHWASRWDIGTFFPGVPEKVMLAKLRRLKRAGKLDGCSCGCRGDFVVLDSPTA